MKLRRTVWSLLAGLAICLAYANSFHNNFAFDDSHTIVDNPAIRSLRNIPHFFTDATTFSVLPANRTYRPTVSTTLAIDYALGHGYVPFWFHLDTFLFFLVLIASLFGLYFVLLNKTEPAPRNWWLALFAATWFGLHPAIAETVNYIIQRGDLYCTLGCVAALLIFARYSTLRKTGLYLLPLVFALLSKPPAVVFPFLLFFYVFFFEAKQRRALTSLLAALPTILVTAAMMLLQSAMTPKTFMPSGFSAAAYRLTQPYVWLRYFGSFFLPIHLNVDTDLKPFTEFNLQALLGFTFLAVLILCIWLTARRRTLYPIAYGLLWFIITQLPTSFYSLAEVENDHRMFFSFVGLMLAVVWSAWLLLQRLLLPTTRSQLKPAIVAAALLMLSGYAYGVRQRNFVWHDSESLWLDDTIKSPHNGRGLMNYGLALLAKGDDTKALDSFQKALAFTPYYPSLEINLGVCLSHMGARGDAQHGAQAEAHFQRAVSLAPNDDLPHAFYGQWLLEQLRLTEAIMQLQSAVSLNPARLMQRELLIQAYLANDDLAAARAAAEETLRIAPESIIAREGIHPPARDDAYWINLSLQQYRLGRYPDSIVSAKRALQINPRSAEAYNNIGAAYGAMLQWDDAIQNVEEALKIQPALQIAQNNLKFFRTSKALGTTNSSVDSLINQSLLLNRAGQYQQSIDAARAALKINPHSAEAWNNIAANYEAMGKWDEAIDAAQKAIAIKPDFQLAKNNLAWSQSQKNAKH